MRLHAGAYTVGIRTWLQGLFRGKWVETSYKGRNEFQGRYKGESTPTRDSRPGSNSEPRLGTQLETQLETHALKYPQCEL